MARISPARQPCPYCGDRGEHSPGCPETTIAEQAQQIETLQAERDALRRAITADSTIPAEQWTIRDAVLLAEAHRQDSQIVDDSDDYGEARRLKAALAAQTAAWAELGALLKTGGMDDPRFLIGAVEAQAQHVDVLTQALRRIYGVIAAMQAVRAEYWDEDEIAEAMDAARALVSPHSAK